MAATPMAIVALTVASVGMTGSRWAPAPASSAKRAPSPPPDATADARSASAATLRPSASAIGSVRAQRIAATAATAAVGDDGEDAAEREERRVELDPGLRLGEACRPSGNAGLAATASATPATAPPTTAGSTEVTAAPIRRRRSSPRASRAAASLGRRCRWRETAWATTTAPATGGDGGDEVAARRAATRAARCTVSVSTSWSDALPRDPTSVERSAVSARWSTPSATCTDRIVPAARPRASDRRGASVRRGSSAGCRVVDEVLGQPDDPDDGGLADGLRVALEARQGGDRQLVPDVIPGRSAPRSPSRISSVLPASG